MQENNNGLTLQISCVNCGVYGAVDCKLYSTRGDRLDTISRPLTACQRLLNGSRHGVNARRYATLKRHSNRFISIVLAVSQLFARDGHASSTVTFRCYAAIIGHLIRRTSCSDHHSVNTQTLLLLLFAKVTHAAYCSGLYRLTVISICIMPLRS